MVWCGHTSHKSCEENTWLWICKSVQPKLSTWKKVKPIWSQCKHPFLRPQGPWWSSGMSCSPCFQSHSIFYCTLLPEPFAAMWFWWYSTTRLALACPTPAVSGSWYGNDSKKLHGFIQHVDKIIFVQVRLWKPIYAILLLSDCSQIPNVIRCFELFRVDWKERSKYILHNNLYNK